MKQSANRLNISESDLLSYINKTMPPTTDRPNGFGITSTEYALSFTPPKAWTTARRILQQMVKSGKLKSKQMIENRHIVTVYYK